MSLARTPERLRLPATLRAQLDGYRRRVWSVKLAEAACAAAFGVVCGFLVLFAADRLSATPDGLRSALFAGSALGCAVVPYALHRWVWLNRRHDQLARTLGVRLPNFGDQLLGVIELVKSDAEQARSRALCEAAVLQVAEDAGRRDFRQAVPRPRHRLWAGLLAVPALVALGLLAAFPAAATNAWARFLAPWKAIPRYTFAAVAPLPGVVVVPHGEPFTLRAVLKGDTAWKPKQGAARLGAGRAVAAPLRDGAYAFDLPPQIEAGDLDVRVGDYRQTVRVEPKLRPELTAVVADVKLPAYLELPKPVHKDVRGGALALVKGSRAVFSATAGRALASATVDGKAVKPVGPTVASPPLAVEASRKVEFAWSDQFGLAGKEPFVLSVTAREDEAPALSVEGLPRQKVVLDTELLNFKVHAQDDHGVKRIGLSWQGADDPSVASPASGDRVLAAGAPDRATLDVPGTFSAKALGIEPQPINLRVYVEDYFPGRPRVSSPVFSLYVLNAEQHAIWLTEQLSKWHRQSLEVRDRELQLFETNKQLRALAPAELEQTETRKKIETQATAERANGRRLSTLVAGGEELVRQAMRNPEFGVGHLEKWAEMLQILKDIAANRMPSVADLLKQASTAPSVASNGPSNRAPTAGPRRSDAGAGAPAEVRPSTKPPTAVPSVADRESSQNAPNKPGEPQEAAKKNPSSPSLRLAQTTLTGKGGTPPPAPAPAPAVEEAVKQQQDLLAEFEKVADELNRVLANLEGSTLVKRLKAASRLQYRIAGRINDLVSDTFGVVRPPARPAQTQMMGRRGILLRQMRPQTVTPEAAKPPPDEPTPAGKVLAEMGALEAKGSQDVSVVMDDMQSYFERRRFMQFKNVLEEMRKSDVIGSLRSLGDDLRHEQGLSIAQAEYWSDTLDRWAEDLVDPTKSGSCPGSRSRGSLPPSIVLEVLLILEGEVNLREETRVAQQARGALGSEEFAKRGKALAGAQKGLEERVNKVTKRILELPDAEKEFAREIALLGQVEEVMAEATEILGTPETGPTAIAAETEAIELLLKSKRINPGGGGGGGSDPGGGGKGTTNDSALALIGNGSNEKEVREDHGTTQATGEAGPSLPEEFRAGLDEYFNRLEKGPAGQ